MQPITVAELVFAAVMALLLLPVIGIVLRRRWLSSQGWVFNCSVRAPRQLTPRTGWVLGVARLNGEDLEWYRVFSASLRPRLVLHRGDVRIAGSREMAASERALVLYDQTRIATLAGSGGDVEVAMAPSDLTALLSWFEAAPPGLAYR